MAHHDVRRAIPRLQLGDRRDQHRATPTRASRPRWPRRRPSCSTASRTSCTTSRASGCTTACRPCCPADRWGAFLSNSGAEAVEAAVKLARDRDEAAGDRRLPRRLPRPHRTGDGADLAPRMCTAATSSRCRGRSTSPTTRTATGRPWRHDPSACAAGCGACDGCSCDWEGRLEELFHTLVYPEHVAAFIVEPVLGEGGYVVPPVGFLPAAPRDRRPPRDPPHRGRGPDRLRADRAVLRRGALRRRAGHPHVRQGRRVRPPALGDHREAGHPPAVADLRARRDIRRATSSPAPPRTRRSTSSRTRASSQRTGARRPAARRAAHAQGRHRTIGDARGLGLWSRWSS